MQFDRVAHRRTDEAWLAEIWRHARVLLISPKSATPVDEHDRAIFADAAQVPDLPRRFLGMVDDVAYFTVTTEPEGDNWRTLREIGAGADDLEAALVVSAIALEQWHQRHRYCPQCGSPTVEVQAGWVRECTTDGSLHFPRTDPAVIMLVHDGDDRALLGRGHQWAEGRFSTLAGFVEPGESIEAAVAREVYEEVGVAVHDIRYVASQPWPFPASLMLGFTARLRGEAAITLDPVEMAEAHWFTRDEIRHAAQWVDEHGGTADPDLSHRLRGVSPQLSISRYLIDLWLDGKIC